MRRLVLLLCFALPIAASAQVVEVIPADRITLECPSTTNSGPRGRVYEMISTGDVQVCFGATSCTSGGDERPKGNHGLFFVGANVNIACDGEGTLQFIPVEVR